MPNIVYVLTNPAMPGLVKIGMTDRDDVQRRMNDLYTTGVPLPFECVAAREIEDKEALEIERALHTAFGPNRINGSREFFQIDPEQVQVLLRVMPGKDVTPQLPERDAGTQDGDQAAASEYKKRQARTNEMEFMDSLNEAGAVIYGRVLALGNLEGMRVRWGTKGFSLNVVFRWSDGASLLRVPSLGIQPADVHGVQFNCPEVQCAPGSGGRPQAGRPGHGAIQPRRQGRGPLLPDRPAHGRIATGGPDGVDERGHSKGPES